ncbi:MAG: hypothetical protein R2778_19240 [Saprospiraceae bacterium]
MLPLFPIVCKTTLTPIFHDGGLGSWAQQSNSLKPELNVFPNPVIDNFSVYDNNDQVAHIVVFNLIGKKGKIL